MIDPTLHIKPGYRAQASLNAKVHQQSNESFGQMLKSEQQKITISKHANERLHQRGIQMNQSEWNVISEKLKEASQKGITDALVVTKDAALVANTKSQTIITALNRNEAASHIFTNINGTILLDSSF
ncbi:TIGR02530 family flagellar biosynthesis protein [Alkalicoccobacillus gibsonii]|jgi:flagellar operon protein|uniref:TIGR02530 family flagellar biosynthesis protein n=1 Tax=Alkalicoccobacillus gibsonii TaxID=79881 RepID=UPI001933D1DD|nr:TIGR02530 family flagellar biosynthesis protein [Alkalicoccobacillus gibsonii]MBM0065152.1 flagellar protein [Alkalicoccobacillus gibsonii]